MEIIAKRWGQKTKAEKYLEFVNDWLTIDAIADNYGMTNEGMKELLNEGKIEHLENCVTVAKNKAEILLKGLETMKMLCECDIEDHKNGLRPDDKYAAVRLRDVILPAIKAAKN